MNGRSAISLREVTVENEATVRGFDVWRHQESREGITKDGKA